MWKKWFGKKSAPEVGSGGYKPLVRRAMARTLVFMLCAATAVTTLNFSFATDEEGYEQEPPTVEAPEGDGGFAGIKGASDIVPFEAGDQSDLFNFVTSVVMKDGKNNTVADGGTANYGETYTFSINFKETLGRQFEYSKSELELTDKSLKYTLPSVLSVITPVGHGSPPGVILTSNNSVIGWYTIDLDGSVEVWFGDFDTEGKPAVNIDTGEPENFIHHYTDATFTLDIKAKFTEDPRGIVIFGTDSQVNVHLAYNPGIRVEKENEYDEANETIDYTVVITASESNDTLEGDKNLKNIKLVDILQIGSDYLSNDTPEIYKNVKYIVKGNNGIPRMGPTDITSLVRWIPGNGTDHTRLEYEFPSEVELGPGESIVVTYTLDLQKMLSVEGNTEEGRSKHVYGFTVNNTATASGRTSETVEYTDYAISDRSVEKTVTVEKTGARRGNSINWNAKIGSKTSTVPLNGGKVTDTMSRTAGLGTIAFPDAKDIIIDLYNSSGLIGSFNGSQAVFDFAFGPGDVPTSFSFTVPGQTVLRPDNGQPFGPITYFEINYVTKPTPTGTPGGTSLIFKNDIDFDGKSDDASVTFAQYAAPLRKTAVVDEDDPTKVIWDIYIGNGSTVLSGDITDALGFTAGSTSKITSITLWNEPTGTSGLTTTDRVGGTTREFTIKDDVHELAKYITLSSTGFVFEIPGVDDNVPPPSNQEKFGEIYQVRIFYETTIEGGIDGGPIKYTNTIGHGDKKLEAEIPATMTKTSSRIKKLGTEYGEEHKDKYGIEYTIVVTVPSGMFGRRLNVYDYTGAYDYYSETANYAPFFNNEPLGFKVEMAGVPDFQELYTEYTKTTTLRAWTLYLGSKAPSAAATTRTWPYSDARTFTITYALLLESELTNSTTTKYDKTLEEALRENKDVPNVYAYNNAVLREGSSPIVPNVITRDIWPIYKTAEVSEKDDSVFDYSVRLNPVNPSTTGRPSLFTIGKEALFTDTFDLRLEYVPGSLYVVYRPSAAASSQRYYVPAESVLTIDKHLDIFTGAESNSISFDFGDLWRVTAFNGNQANSTVYTALVESSTSSSYQYWYTLNYDFEVRYQLQVKDPNKSFADDEGPAGNTATIISPVLNGESFSAGALVEYQIEPLSKFMTTNDNSNIVEVEIIVNPSGRKLNLYDNTGLFTAKDIMNDTLAFYLTSIKFYLKGPDGEWNTTEEEKSSVPDTKWYVRTYAGTGPDGKPANIADMVLPDETPVKIVYQALIKADVGQKVDLYNMIQVYGYKDMATMDEYQIQDTTASAGGSRLPLFLTKLDEDDNTVLLGGAEFGLYMATLENNYYTTGPPTDLIDDIYNIYIDGEPNAPVNFYFVSSATTNDTNGEASFYNSWLSASHGALYLVVEKTAPSGYYLPTPPDNHKLFVLNQADVGIWAKRLGLEASKFEVLTDALEITNKLVTGEIEISKTVTGDGDEDKFFEFQLLKRGEQSDTPVELRGLTLIWDNGEDPPVVDDPPDGDDPPEGDDPPDGEDLPFIVPESIGKFKLRHDEKLTIKGLVPGTYIITETNYKGYTTSYHVVGGSQANSSSAELVIPADGGAAAVEFTNDYTPGTAYIDIYGEKTITGKASTDKVFTFNAVQVDDLGEDKWTGGGTALSGSDTITGADDFKITINLLTTAGSPYYFKVTEDRDGHGKEGWLYSQNIFWVEVKVTDDGEGGANAVITDCTDSTGEERTGVTTFTNRYVSTKLALHGTKKIENADNTDETFMFSIVEIKPGDPEYPKEVATGKTVATGLWSEPTGIVFDEITYLYDGIEPRIHTYVISEVDLPDGWRTSDEYRIYVKVEYDEETGVLTATAYSDPSCEDEYEIEEIKDFLTFVNSMGEKRISVEVDKDTIKRTSAAFDGTGANVMVGNQLINNPAKGEVEYYRYDINFRSTSNVDADEFVVEDPLESVFRDHVRLEALWTPAVWGDKDGRFNVWYQDAKGTGNSGNTAPVGNGAITQVANPQYPTGSEWKLWKTIDVRWEANDPIPDEYALGYLWHEYGVIGCQMLSVSELNFKDGDYVTALRFEFGAVKVGFTSKNYYDGNLNDETIVIEDNVRDTNGSEDYYPDGKGWIKDPTSPVNPGANDKNTVETNTDDSGFQPFAMAFMSFMSFMPIMPLNDIIGALDTIEETDVPEKGSTSDWTPNELNSFFPTNNEDSEQLLALGSNFGTTKAGSPLEPASYLVSAFGPMSGANIEIVSSVSALISGAGGLYDSDQDAVLTRVIVPFTTDPDIPDAGELVKLDSFLEHAKFAGLKLINGVWYDAQGRRASLTLDTFALNLWIILCVAALVCVGLLVATYIPGPGKKGRRRKGIPETGKGGGLK